MLRRELLWPALTLAALYFSTLGLAAAQVVAQIPKDENHGASVGSSWNPESIHWQKINPNGTRFALLEGVRDQPGVAFSYAFFIPAGVWDGAHTHTADARVFVARGSLHLGYGDHLDPEKTIAYPAGSYLVVPAGARHFDGSPEDTLIIGTAVGPWATHYLASDAPTSAGTPPN